MSAVNDMLVLTGVEAGEFDDWPDDPAEQYYCALQRQINSGQVWLFEGSVGRGAMTAIEAGLVMLGPVQHRDYYGNAIPSRSGVKPGTKGSYAYVVEHCGEEWARMLTEAGTGFE